MKKNICIIALMLASQLAWGSARVPKTKVSDLMARYHQLMRKPFENETKIREVLNKIKPADPEWADARSTEFEFLINQSKGQGIYRGDEESPLPDILPGVPTPPEYMDDVPPVIIPADNDYDIDEESGYEITAMKKTKEMNPRKLTHAKSRHKKQHKIS